MLSWTGEYKLHKQKGKCIKYFVRYWHSTAAFALGRAIQSDPTSYSLPPAGDAFYCWPEDLLKPDHVFLLYVSEEERLKRLSRRTNATDEEKHLKENAEFRRTYDFHSFS